MSRYSHIVDILKNKINTVAETGESCNDTREITGAFMPIRLQDRLNEQKEQPWDYLGCELRRVVDFYEDELHKDHKKKLADEIEHYKSLKHTMLHQINKVKFFHKQGLDSRKLIIFSDDCISSIQLVCRDKKIALYVHMRSSDAINLLPLDVCFLIMLIEDIIEVHDIPTRGKDIDVMISFGSIHIYEADMNIAREAGAPLPGTTE